MSCSFTLPSLVIFKMREREREKNDKESRVTWFITEDISSSLYSVVLSKEQIHHMNDQRLV